MEKISLPPEFHAPRTAEETPLPRKGIVPTESAKFNAKELEAKARMEAAKVNQKLARTLIVCIVTALSVLCVSSYVFKILGLDTSTDIFEKAFTPIQYALFTLLGFLFGEKTNGNKT